jgi:hypothetical protein
VKRQVRAAVRQRAARHVHERRRVTFLERRKGFGTASMDRRKSYVDVMERVLGNSLPSGAPRRPRIFVAEFQFGRWSVGSTISEIQVTVLDSIEYHH